MKIIQDFYAVPEHPNHPIFVIGDIHGDLGLLICLLHDCAKVIDSNLKWKKRNKACIVLLGDMVDRCRPGDTPLFVHTNAADSWLTSSIFGDTQRGPGEIMCEEVLIQLYLMKLQEQAVQEGGYILKIIGNHELMNIDHGIPRSPNVLTDIHYEWSTPLGKICRKYFPLVRGSKFAQAIMTDNAFAIAQLGVWIFVHGGIRGFIQSPSLVKKINPELRTYFRRPRKQIDPEVYTFLFQTNSGIAWDRTFGFDECSDTLLQRSFDAIHSQIEFPKPTKLAIGHCTQMINEVASRVFTKRKSIGGRAVMEYGPTILSKGPKGICSGCSGNVFRLDSGMSRAFDTKTSIDNPVDSYRLPQLLEVRANGRVVGVRKLKDGVWDPRSRKTRNLPPWLHLSVLNTFLFKNPW